MSLTPHHARYYAHGLTRRAPSGMDRLSTALFDAAVDLNPHQIEAALIDVNYSRLATTTYAGSPEVAERPSAT